MCIIHTNELLINYIAKKNLIQSEEFPKLSRLSFVYLKIRQLMSLEGMTGMMVELEFKL